MYHKNNCWNNLNKDHKIIKTQLLVQSKYMYTKALPAEAEDQQDVAAVAQGFACSHAQVEAEAQADVRAHRCEHGGRHLCGLKAACFEVNGGLPREPEGCRDN